MENGFRTRVSGSEGEVFDPMLELEKDAWLDLFKQEQGNFAFGFNSIKNEAIVEKLEELVSKETK